MEEKKDIYILAIESSCDETAAAVVKNGREVLSNVISSQIDLHTLYGGVVPEIASRKHVENIDGVIKKALADAGMTLEEMDAIGVTYGPGLVGALLVGLAEAKALAYAAGKPLIGVHHIEGHICANYIQNKDFAPPYMALVVSGGHSHLVYVSDYGKYEIMGHTRDDATGTEIIGCSFYAYNRRKAFDSFQKLSFHPCSTGLYGRLAFPQFQNAYRISDRYLSDAHKQFVPFWD